MTSSVKPSARGLSQLIGRWQTSGDPVYRQLAHALRGAVLDGRLPVGARLPAERELAAELGLSRTTVASAYAALREDGWLTSRRGSGSVITLKARPGAIAVEPVPRPVDPGSGLIDLTSAGRDAPEGLLDAAIDRARERMRSLYRGDGYFPLGLDELRERIAGQYTASGAPTEVEQILITNGAQHGFSLALGTLSHPLDRVIVESPTYPMALDLVRHTGRIPVPVGLLTTAQHAWVPDLLRSSFTQSAASVAFLMPDFQNPTGALMDAATRELVMGLAAQTGTSVLVDESFRSLALDDEVELPPPMAAFDEAGVSVSIGSLSKAIWGGLRVGWIRAGRAVAERLAVARVLGDMAGSLLDQLVALEMLDDLEPLARSQAAETRASRDDLLAALRELAPTWQVASPSGGATMWVRLPDAVATEAARIAPRLGVTFTPGTRFGPDGAMDNYLRIPLTLHPGRLREAVPRLVAAVDAASASRRPAGIDGWLT